MAPTGSVTVPVTVANVLCADRRVGIRAMTAIAAGQSILLFGNDMEPPLAWSITHSMHIPGVFLPAPAPPEARRPHLVCQLLEVGLRLQLAQQPPGLRMMRESDMGIV